MLISEYYIGRSAAKLSQLISVFCLVGVLQILEYMLISVFYLDKSAVKLSMLISVFYVDRCAASLCIYVGLNVLSQ